MNPRHPSMAGLPRMLCPVCGDRYAAMIDAGCPACKGQGVMVLASRAGVPNAAVAGAARLYLGEFSARWLDSGGDPAWRAVNIATAALVAAGFIIDAGIEADPGFPQPDPEAVENVAAAARALARELGARIDQEPGADELSERRQRRSAR